MYKIKEQEMKVMPTHVVTLYRSEGVSVPMNEMGVGCVKHVQAITIG